MFAACSTLPFEEDKLSQAAKRSLRPEKALELKSAKEIIKLYTDNRYKDWEYYLCCAKMANKDVDEEHVSRASIVIHKVMRSLGED